MTVAQIRALVLINSSKIWAFVNPKYLGGPRFLVAILVTDLLVKLFWVDSWHKNDFFPWKNSYKLRGIKNLDDWRAILIQLSISDLNLGSKTGNQTLGQRSNSGEMSNFPKLMKFLVFWFQLLFICYFSATREDVTKITKVWRKTPKKFDFAFL